MSIDFKVIKPNLPRYKEMTAVLQTSVSKMANRIQKDFESTVATWEHKVVFQQEIVGWRIEVFTTDPIYGYVDQGTRPHIIRPKRAKRLAFASAFTPKTKPGVLGSTADSHGPVDTFRQEVHHPGTEAREFTEAIAKKWGTTFATVMQDAMAGAVQVSGHSLKK